ncbi:sushi, von Willebrand factor type A, EGF and pentraxin domain-containing protein 1-like [Mytilus edulis]|uniref:sushi, von Willebrand factor type A, EGF and pentraxin domain-containing protein 1-like n=1 Tax=Mytilus edulis TaxID=6550 RepID=UPI0039F133AC
MTTWSYLLTFVLLGLLESGRSTKLSFKKATYVPNERCLVTSYIKAKCGFNSTNVPNGKSCRLSETNPAFMTEHKCHNGKWIQEIYGNFSIREKRQAMDMMNKGTELGAEIGMLVDGPLGAAVGGAVGFVVSGFLCIFICKDEGPPPNQPPSIDCSSFKIDANIIASPGKTTKVITFGQFQGEDAEDGKTKVISTPESPVKLHRGTNLIMFTTKDKEGFQASCAKTVEVQVTTCQQPSWPVHGFARCENHEVLMGTTCTFTCQEGYQLNGQPKIKCIAEKKFDHPVPTCSVIHCTNDTNIRPFHGHAHCDNNAFPFGTVCVSECDKGYGSQSAMFSKCTKDRKWSTSLPLCEDKTPPEFITCPSTIHAFADSGSSKATVSWITPSAKDNSGLLPTVRQTKGPRSGQMFESITEIAYVAEDGSSNTSPPCTFFVVVERQFCGPPVFNGDLYLQYTCKNKFQYGSECDIKCKGSYPLVGNAKMTCRKNVTSGELYWDWGNLGKPYCKQNKCPVLQPPKNGALTCDKWMYGTQCAMQCNGRYDIPLGVGGIATFTGLFTCSTVAGKWSPLLTVPGCTSRRIGRHHRIPGELVYKGDCNDKATQDQIKQNFVNLMQKLESDPGFKSVCPDKITCNVENVEVTCGTTRKRRRARRASNDEIFLTFAFIRKYEPFGNGTVSAMKHANEKFQLVINITRNMMNQGVMDVPNAQIDRTSYQFGDVDIDCGPGRFPKYSTLTCAACAGGSYLDPDVGACHKCPRGFYKSDIEAVNCTACPRGMSTEEEGTEMETECKDICPSGFNSANGLEPCTPCLVGFYSSTKMSTSCDSCDEHQLTKSSGSSHASDCIDYDLLLEDVDVSLSLKGNIMTMQTLSVSLWCKLIHDHSRLEIDIGGNGGLRLIIESKVGLIYAGQTVSTGVSIETETWVHIAVVIESAGNIILYKDGSNKLTRHVSPIQITKPAVHIKSRADILVSSLTVIEKALALNEVKQLSQSCSTTASNSLLTSNDLWKKDQKAFQMIIPSVCDAVDECAANPCHGHICQNKINGYTCICSGGYTGQTCQTQPDFCKGHECENGATCRNGASNYTCVCPSRFNGTFCEIAPVNGGWTDWSEWLPCSTSCGGGDQNRYRYCSNPVPGLGGHICVGKSMEKKVCNTMTCPKCPNKPSAYGVHMSCNTTGDTTTCSAACRPGLAFVPGRTTLKQYKCGQSTNYIWNGQPPSCSKLHGPSTIITHSAMTYTNFPCHKVEDAKTEILKNAKSGLQCVINKTCEINVEINGCNSKRKRSTGVDAVITLTIPLDNGDNLDLENYTSTKKLSPALLNLVKAIAELEKSAQEINKTGKVFELSGVKVQFDKVKVQTSSEVVCLPGRIRIEAFCIECPTGTFYNKQSKCEPCHLGMYQDLTGQTVCKPCPDGYTTNIIGAQQDDLCIVAKPVDSKEDSTEASESSKLIIITSSVVASVVIIIGIIGALLLRQKLRSKYRKKDMGSNMSFNMVKPSKNVPGKSTQLFIRTRH